MCPWLIQIKMNSRKTILLTIDVEDWFQVENFRPWIPFETWDQRELRVEKNTHQLLDLFDSFAASHKETHLAHEFEDTAEKKEGLKNFRRRRIVVDHFHPESDPEKEKSQKSCKSCLKEKNKNRIQTTFFVLGWIAEYRRARDIFKQFFAVE